MASLNGCKRELKSIIAELQDIEWGIRRDFVGIGQDKCATCITKVVDHYEYVQKRLNQVNMSRLAEWIMGDS